ncbi:MAG: alpha-L-rhamnosidase, partial [Paenibacillus sp.]|nr:alpha-L-rhamnosidase [Paenibacillus sp.]
MRISADSYYRVWINGKEAGEGPVRSTPRHWYYDDYDVSGYVRTGDNVIAVDVWHYGHSNYQYIENRAGLIARLDLGEDGQAGSFATDNSWKAKQHDGFESHTVKRNVNIGWLELFDARKWNDVWLTSAYDDSDWGSAVRVAEGGGGVWGELHTASIEPMAKSRIYPSQ